MDKVDEQRAWSDVNKREHKISKTGHKQDYFQHLHISKELPTRPHYGEILQALSGNSMCWGASLKCLCINAHSMGNKYEVLEICVLLQTYSLGTVETW